MCDPAPSCAAADPLPEGVEAPAGIFRQLTGAWRQVARFETPALALREGVTWNQVAGTVRIAAQGDEVVVGYPAMGSDNGAIVFYDLGGI